MALVLNNEHEDFYGHERMRTYESFSLKGPLQMPEEGENEPDEEAVEDDYRRDRTSVVTERLQDALNTSGDSL
jgi:hypothetical protein